MSSGPNVADVENAPALEGEPTSNPLKDEIPKPEGDPFEHLLKPMLEKDTVQCTAWKDEVQNILIFAGLFSAVVTAFIIESYKRLQPDSNDAIIGLLAHIADRLDNAPNQTDSVSSIITSTDFAPSRSDINVNVFWFISLVLSLTAALIGIITLQWLREHQRYDTALKPREIMAILNARLHSFKQWYVPHIFAGLPLLLQGAIVLFFAGMIEFLFALRVEVAVPVTLAICVPLIFLIATTTLPFLQVCILQDAFRLSINNDVPSPCPYKSPQSLIARRVGLGSRTMFMFLASTIAGAYICIIKFACFIRKLSGYRPPIFHSQRPYLKLRLRDTIPERIRDIRNVSGDWISIDTSWLHVRTSYALSLQMAYRDNHDLVVPRRESWRASILPELYDCTSCFHEILRQNRADADLFGALWDCIAALCSQAVDNFQTVAADIEGRIDESSMTDLCFAFGRFACNDLDVTNPPLTAAFINDVICHEFESFNKSQTMVKALPSGFMTSWLFAIFDIWGYLEPVWARQEKVADQLLLNRLDISPERLFLMSSDETWLPQQVLNIVEHLNSGGDSSHRVICQQFITFLDGCATIPPSSQLLIRPTHAKKAYRAISAYIKVIVLLDGDICGTFAHLTELCNLNGPQNLIQEKPFLLIAACFYLDATSQQLHLSGYQTLLKVILDACGTPEGNLSYADGWTGLDDAINAIYNYHNPSYQPTSNPNSSTSPANLNGCDNNV